MDKTKGWNTDVKIVNVSILSHFTAYGGQNQPSFKL